MGAGGLQLPPEAQVANPLPPTPPTTSPPFFTPGRTITHSARLATSSGIWGRNCPMSCVAASRRAETSDRSASVAVEPSFWLEEEHAATASAAERKLALTVQA